MRIGIMSHSPAHSVEVHLDCTAAATSAARVLESLGRGNPRIPIPSGNGVGKTALLGWLAIWHVATRYPSKCICTAPTSQQLFDALWVEMRRWLTKAQPWLGELFEVTPDKEVVWSCSFQGFINYARRYSAAEVPFLGTGQGPRP